MYEIQKIYSGENFSVLSAYLSKFLLGLIHLSYLKLKLFHDSGIVGKVKIANITIII